MNKFTTLSAALAIALVAAGLAQASEEAPRARAEVLAEREAARTSGELVALIGEDSGSAWFAQQAQPSRFTRQEVLADVRAAALRGDLHALIGEDSGSMFVALPATHGGLLYAGPNVGTPAVDSGVPAAA
jgi:hypothetical protein